MDAKQFVDGVNQGVQPFQDLHDASASSAEYARNQSRQAFSMLNSMCSQFAAGENKDYEAVSRRAHIAAYELMSYGEICACLDVRTKDDCEHIMAAARGMLDRVREQEHQFLEGSLSPSQVFYDDHLNSKVLDVEHGQVSRGSKVERPVAIAEASEMQLA